MILCSKTFSTQRISTRRYQWCLFLIPGSILALQTLAHLFLLCSSDSSGHVRHWHVSTSQCFSTIKEKRQTLAAAVAPDGLGFATAGSDNKVYIYDESTLKLVKTLESRWGLWLSCDLATTARLLHGGMLVCSFYVNLHNHVVNKSRMQESSSTP